MTIKCEECSFCYVECSEVLVAYCTYKDQNVPCIVVDRTEPENCYHYIPGHEGKKIQLKEINNDSN